MRDMHQHYVEMLLRSSHCDICHLVPNNSDLACKSQGALPWEMCVKHTFHLFRIQINHFCNVLHLESEPKPVYTQLLWPRSGQILAYMSSQMVFSLCSIPLCPCAHILALTTFTCQFLLYYPVLAGTILL